MASHIDKRRILDELIRSDFSAFISMAFRSLYPGSDYLTNWHIEVLAEYMRMLIAGEETRMIVCMPPRHLKSFVGSICLPAFVLGHDPTAKFICISYSQSLAEDFAHQTRKLMDSEWYKRIFPHTRLDPKRCRKSDLGTTRNGHRIASSVDGTLTGKGGDFLVLDDLIKAGDVHSDVVREHVNEWFDTSLLSRLDKPNSGRILVIAQRLHVDDLPGRLIERGGWKQLILPLIAHEHERFEIGGTIITRPPGVLLHPERIDEDDAERLRRDIGTNLFEGQYNQRPIPEGGYLFKREWLNYTDDAIDPDLFEAIIQSVDTAYMTAENNDYTVCVTFGIRGDEIHILDVYRNRIEFPEQVKLIPKLRKKWDADLVIVEGIGCGQALAQTLWREFPQKQWVKTVSPKAGKLERAEKQTVKFEQGRIFLPRPAPWRQSFESELAAFPKGKHDDQVDAVTQFLHALDLGNLGTAIQAARNAGY
ncbi:phage terminase large subunit [Aquisediminimonas profunda]|uniref:phage terminase large subunit n=1 Tax=Aquisediminimonas profunda TaxID=1550733 RepID=UPI001C630C7D|nr:phage terminase large subunit [Aquisediminimonas profunda]